MMPNHASSLATETYIDNEYSTAPHLAVLSPLEEVLINQDVAALSFALPLLTLNSFSAIPLPHRALLKDMSRPPCSEDRQVVSRAQKAIRDRRLAMSTSQGNETGCADPQSRGHFVKEPQ